MYTGDNQMQHDPRWSGDDFEDDEWDECSHTLTCECETCMQDHPERFDDEWHNINRADDEDEYVTRGSATIDV